MLKLYGLLSLEFLCKMFLAGTVLVGKSGLYLTNKNYGWSKNIYYWFYLGIPKMGMTFV